jgi:hypothetical protein
MNRVLTLLLASIFTTQLNAMSRTPEVYAPPVWNETAQADQDAAYALANNDLRLLAYTTRSIMVPGIRLEDKELLSSKCGLRMLKGFGDVVRSDAQLQKMKALRGYAEKYNEIIAAQCSATDNKR